MTDRLYLRAYLDAYWRSDECEGHRKAAKASIGRYLEDIHYAFFEYAGSNLAHYIFDKDAEAGCRDVTDEEIRMQFIANRVFLVADQDAKKDSKHERLTKMAEGTDQFRYYVTKGREIENMISAPLLQAILGDDFIRDPKITEDKIQEIQENNYRMKGLGEYLDELFGKLEAKVRAKSGTLKDHYKLKLAEKARDHLQNLAAGNDPNAAWKMLSDEAKALAKQIDAFIRQHNPRVSV